MTLFTLTIAIDNPSMLSNVATVCEIIVEGEHATGHRVVTATDWFLVQLQEALTNIDLDANEARDLALYLRRTADYVERYEASGEA